VIITLASLYALLVLVTFAAFEVGGNSDDQ
jgi:hypothetical protein